MVGVLTKLLDAAVVPVVAVTLIGTPVSYTHLDVYKRQVQAGNVTLGALAPERDRTLVVLSRDGELAVGLRERLERARVVVKDARPDESLTAVGSCRPWPLSLIHI